MFFPKVFVAKMEWNKQSNDLRFGKIELIHRIGE